MWIECLVLGGLVSCIYQDGHLWRTSLTRSVHQSLLRSYWGGQITHIHVMGKCANLLKKTLALCPTIIKIPFFVIQHHWNLIILLEEKKWVFINLWIPRNYIWWPTFFNKMHVHYNILLKVYFKVHLLLFWLFLLNQTSSRNNPYFEIKLIWVLSTSKKK